MNFSKFYADAVREREKKAKKGKYRGQRGAHSTSVHNQALVRPNMPYTAQPAQSQAPSASTYMQKG